MAENFRNENSNDNEDDDYELTPPILGFFSLRKEEYYKATNEMWI